MMPVPTACPTAAAKCLSTLLTDEDLQTNTVKLVGLGKVHW